MIQVDDLVEMVNIHPKDLVSCSPDQKERYLSWIGRIVRVCGAAPYDFEHPYSLEIDGEEYGFTDSELRVIYSS